MRKWKRFSISTACLFVAVLLVLGGLAYADKPDKTGKPDKPGDEDPPAALAYAGDIYYTSYAEGYATLMRVDVSANAPTPEALLSGVEVTAVSFAEHGGDYWLLYSTPTSGQDPDGSARNVMQLRSASGGEVSTIAIQDTMLGLRNTEWGVPTVAWEPGDDAVTFVGLRWTDDGSGAQVADAGIYRQYLTWSSDETSVSASGSPVRLADAQWRWTDDGDAISAHGPIMNWSPDGTQLATTVHFPIINADVDGLVVYDTTTGDETVLYDSAVFPTWTSDGVWVAFQQADPWPTIYRVKAADATLEVLLQAGSSRKTGWWWHGVAWSPEGGAFTSEAIEAKYGRLPQDTEEHNYLRIYDLATGEETTVLQDDDLGVIMAWRP